MNPERQILITGGCGYVGSRVALELNRRGYRIIITDKSTPQERKISFPSEIEFRHCDLCKLDDAKRAVSGVGLVLHLAANIGSLSYMHKHQAEIIRDNSAIDANLYPSMVEAGAGPIIYSSSSMVFQHAPKFPYTEEDINDVKPPTNIYGMSKFVGEYFCRAHNQQFKLPYVIIRYHNIYGSGEDSKGEEPGDIHVIPALIEKVLCEQYPLELLGNPEATRPFTYVDDAVNATCAIIECALQKDVKVINNDFNIGPNRATKILDLAELIWEILGDGRPFKYAVIPTPANTSVRREMDFKKINEATGWEPRISLEDGIKKTAEWIKNRDV